MWAGWRWVWIFEDLNWRWAAERAWRGCSLFIWVGFAEWNNKGLGGRWQKEPGVSKGTLEEAAISVVPYFTGYPQPATLLMAPDVWVSQCVTGWAQAGLTSLVRRCVLVRCEVGQVRMITWGWRWHLDTPRLFRKHGWKDRERESKSGEYRLWCLQSLFYWLRFAFRLFGDEQWCPSFLISAAVNMTVKR